MKRGKTMLNWIIGIVIFSFAGALLYKNIQKSKQGKCPSCKPDRSGKKESCQCNKY